jgi:hypothetical protein
MNKHVMTATFAAGLAAVGWVGWGFVGSSPLALAMTVVIAVVYGVGALELMRFRRATTSLSAALAELAGQPVADVGNWLERLPPSLRPAVRQRMDGERVPLPGPALAPYLVGLLVMLGMLGTFFGMVLTFQGAVFALEASSSLESIRAALAAPIKGLGLSFGTSVAGVASSAMLGLMLALCRRERLAALRALDAAVGTVLRPFSAAQRREDMFTALQAQAQAMPLIAERLQGLLDGVERRHAQLNAQLLDQQKVFHHDATGAYTQLAQAVGASLQDSLAASARVAGETLRPVVEQAMAALTVEAERSHQRLREATDAQMHTLTAQWEGTARSVADTWTHALQSHQQAQQAHAAQQAAALQATADALAQRSQALIGTLEAVSEKSQAAQAAADEARLALWNTSMQDVAGALAAKWEHAGAASAQRQREVSQALQSAAARLEQSLDAAAQAFEARSTALLHAVQATVAQSQVDQAAADQQRLAGWSQSMQGMAETLAAQWRQAAEQATQQQRDVCQVLEGAAAQISGRMAEQADRVADGTARFMDQSDALLQARIDAEAGWAASQTERMDALATVWRTELAALRDAEAARGQAAVDRLDTLQGAVAQHLASLGTALEAPLSRLLQTASDVPQAAAEVITQLRHEMAHLSERDNAALAERTAMMEQLRALLQAVNDAAGQQRAAIESLVGSASQVLAQAGEQFSQALGAQAGKVDEVAAHVAASAVELSSLGESFGHGVGLFAASNEKLMDSLQRVESAIGQSMSRSDEQLAYYVAQAREVIDLSISSQQGIVEDLRRLHGDMAAAVQGAAA